MQKSLEGLPVQLRQRSQCRYLLGAAAILHVCVTLAVFTVGKYQLFPSKVFPNGIGKFASDGLLYQGQVRELANVLKQQGPIAWATKPADLHVRLYSLPLLLTPQGASTNVLLIEPVNLAYYLGILFFMFKIGTLIFDYRTGLIAATIVALWSSFLLHTTQLLRDPLLILCLLIFAWGLTESLERGLSWRRMLGLATATVIAMVCIRIVRLPMWHIVVPTIGLAVGLLVLKMIIQRRLQKPAVGFAVLIVASAAIVPKLQPLFRNQQSADSFAPSRHEAVEQQFTLWEQLASYRTSFKYDLTSQGTLEQVEQSSLIDPAVTFPDKRSIVRYIPRAVEIGLFAPFPNFWLQPGYRVGRAGRMMSGFEMSLTYVIELLAVFGLWKARRKLSAWLIAALIAMGLTALGMIVVNLGALYRMRYPFWALLVMFGAGGISFLYQHFAAPDPPNNLSREAST